jgi:uncharacterized protein YndB with AHSA1/START domain
MAAIVSTTVIDRPPEEVFAFMTDPVTFPRWQEAVLHCQVDGFPIGAGTRCTTTRKIGPSERRFVSEVTEFDPPRRWAYRDVAGPVREVLALTVEPVAEPAGSRVIVELDFEAHGLGRLVVPLVVRSQARRDMPRNLRKLKLELESQPL